MKTVYAWISGGKVVKVMPTWQPRKIYHAKLRFLRMSRLYGPPSPAFLVEKLPRGLNGKYYVLPFGSAYVLIPKNLSSSKEILEEGWS